MGMVDDSLLLLIQKREVIWSQFPNSFMGVGVWVGRLMSVSAQTLVAILSGPIPVGIAPERLQALLKSK